MDNTSPLIELVDITKTYFTGGEVAIEVLRGISLAIHAGEFVAIMGASGSGKSTLMNLIGCLDRPTGGHYSFAGQDVAGLDRDQLARLRREAFGFVFQNYNLIASATAAENVEIPAIYAGVSAGERRERAEELLVSLGLADRLEHRPNQLSGGQQQRVSIARALMNGGKIILADEPTGALDSHSGAEVIKLLQQLPGQGHTVILITHNLEIAKHANRLIEIRDGMILNDSTPPRQNFPAENVQTSAFMEDDEQSASLISEAAESMKMALRSLRTNLFRTILTLLGIMIGVAAVIAMLALGEGAKKSVLDRIGSMGTNLLLVRSGAPNQRGPGPDSTVASLIPTDAIALAELPNVQSAVPESTGNVTVRYGNRDVQTGLTATSPEYPLTRSWPVAKGTFFNDADVQSYSAVVVLGQTVTKNLFGEHTEPIGQFVLLDNVPFMVIGVLSAKGATPWGHDADDAVFVPLTTGSLRLLGYSYLRSITLAVKDVATIDATQDQITVFLRALHGKEDFQVRNQAALLETVSETYNTLTLLLGSIAVISLLVGGIGVMNIMLVTVSERTREIGIRMATGARMRDILLQFLTEATVVSALGGVIGVM
ncbi:MAG: macrolide ABC transporter permease/ATP-binding protein MacB, partial [Gammaproteobacteria bacterium RBG_16_51_14]